MLSRELENHGIPSQPGCSSPTGIIGEAYGSIPYLKLFPESLLGLLTGICHFIELPHPVLDVGGVDAGGVEGLENGHKSLPTTENQGVFPLGKSCSQIPGGVCRSWDHSCGCRTREQQGEDFLAVPKPSDLRPLPGVWVSPEGGRIPAGAGITCFR